MQQIVHLAAEPRPPADSLKAALLRASRALGISYRRTISFWYGHTERVRVSPEEAARMRAEADQLRRLKLARMEQEIAELRTLVRQLDAEAAAGGSGSVADGHGSAPCQVAAQ